jgi:hypothetical protein
MIRRRALLLGLPAGAAAAAAVVGLGELSEHDVIPGRVPLHRLLHLNGPNGTVPDVAAGPVTQGRFRSRHRHTEVGYAVCRPPGHRTDPLPVVISLHGENGSHLSGLGLGLPQFLAQAVADGVPPFAIATVDGGTGYYHPHDGEDAGAMITDELIPLLGRHRLDVARIGLHGVSMGGYGALRIAGLLGAPHVAGVAVAAPALWSDAAGAPPDGFATAAEADRYTLLGHQRDLAGIPVRLEVGDGDPFRDAVRDYAAGFPAGADVTLTVNAGGHTTGYFRRMLPGDLAFLGARLR